jgi:hypothetical protein
MSELIDCQRTRKDRPLAGGEGGVQWAPVAIGDPTFLGEIRLIELSQRPL